jgi:lysophospholipase L1-like esterase
MKTPRTITWVAIFALCLPLFAAQTPELHWVGTWAASPMGLIVDPGSPAAGNATYRNIVRVSMGGTWLRVQISNEFGQQPLMVAEAYAGLSEKRDALRPGSNHALSFGGRSSISIPTGGMVLSDPVAMQVPPIADLAVSLYLPSQPLSEMTCHSDAQSTNFIAHANSARWDVLNTPRKIDSWCFVKGVDVGTTDANAAAIVAFGDSITDGWRSTPDSNSRWPDALGARLQADARTRNLSVLNEGISGNRLLHDDVGPNAIARFNRDVISQAGVRYLILLEGINDIGDVVETHDPADPVSVQDMISALSQLATRAHEHGIKVFAATLTPYEGAAYFSEHGEQTREAVNRWIRTTFVFDGVIDFDQITRDPAKPSMFLSAFDSGDHLHPNNAGYHAMGSSIDLSLFH